ncbi:hypothetical protein OV207_24535 [Corallococcus sp. BB11-1]|uniref:hypothetical protein n=1 Tax=Corallococcus sp. BB11-1 TaxID=2996783 RepID=UPI00226FF48F|nr:hypothetical protein [Corallococcus sp. BB11-1]MCY1034642.1 hypothetical protein [Corallococcus sp. BB11-1]
MDVKIEGKNVQLLGDPMLNNGGPSGTPANAATLMGVIQTSGFVTAVTGDEACPLNASHEPHGPLEETEQTKTDAAQLASMLEVVLKEKGYRLVRMLGVVQCRCGKKKYADHSSVTLTEFEEAVRRLKAPWRSPPGSLSLRDFLGKKTKEERDANAKAADNSERRIRERLLARFANASEVEELWVDAEKRFKDSIEHRFKVPDFPAAYPPGACAAQKAIVLAWDNGAATGALTERWFHTEGGETMAPIQFLDAKTNTVKTERFKSGETVPPCRTCELIVPVMLCPGDKEAQCLHQD